MWDNKLKRLAFLAANAAYIVLCLIFVSGISNCPYIGLLVENKNDAWTVVYSDPYGEGVRLGIRNGDVILEMDNLAAGSHPSVQKWGEVEGVSELRIRSIGEEDKTILIPKYPFLKTLITELPIIILGLSFWSMGLYAILKRPVLPQTQALFRLNWLIGLLFIIVPAASRGLFLAKELMLIGLPLTPILLVDFIADLLKLRRQKTYKTIICLLAVLPVIIVITISLKWLGLIYAAQELRIMALANGLIGFMASLYLMFSSRKNLSAQEKNQISFILAGLIISLFPFILFTVIPTMLGIEPVFYSKFTILFIVILPFSMSHVLINYHLPDSRKLFRDIISFFITGITVSLLLYSFLYVGKWITSFDIDVFLSLLSIISANIIIFLVVRSIVNKIMRSTNHLICNYEKSAIEEVNQSVDESTILDELTSQMDLDGAMFIVEESERSYSKKVFGRYSENSDEERVLEEYYLRTIDNTHKGQLLSPKLPAEYYFPFVSENFKCGLFLGYRRSRRSIRPEELPMLDIITYITCQRLKAIYDIKSLQERVFTSEKKTEEIYRERHVVALIKRWLFNSFEEDKKRIAREIHDGPLQIGLYLSRMMKEMNNKAVQSFKSGEISEMQELIEEVNYELRSICSGLRPSVLKDLGLLPALDSFIQEIMYKELITITVEVKGLPREQRLGEDIELAIFRLVQEGIRNIIKHSNSNEAEIILSQKKQEIHVELRDYGKGFIADKVLDLLENSFIENRFGIIGMKERIESLGGEFRLVSEPGMGTVIHVSLPLKEAC